MSPPPSRTYVMAFALSLVLMLGACAGSSVPPAEPGSSGPEVETSAAAGPATPQAKERTVIVKVPVLLKESVYYPDGLLDEYTVFSYDESKTLLREKAVYDPARTEPRERTQSDYAVSGRLASDLVYDAEGRLRLRREYGFNAAGALISEKTFDAAGLPLSASSYAYDAQGRRLEWKALDGAGNLKASTSYAYDGAGLPLLVELRDSAGRSAGAFRYEYAGSGQVEKKSFLNPDGSLQKYELINKAEGRALRYELRRPDDSLVESREYQYGSLGELLVELRLDGSGRLREKRVYEYGIREDQRVEVYFE